MIIYIYIYIYIGETRSAAAAAALGLPRGGNEHFCYAAWLCFLVCPPIIKCYSY